MQPIETILSLTKIFTDLTFHDPRFFGILFDGASSDNRFTLMLSQGGDLLNTAKFSTFRATTERSPVLIFGGHWETKLGNVLTLGATYFNQHMANTQAIGGLPELLLAASQALAAQVGLQILATEDDDGDL